MKAPEIKDINSDVFKEFTFNIEDAKFTILSDRGTERAALEPNKESYVQLHFHSYFELFYINNGNFTVKFENEEVPFQKDDMIIVSPGVNHRTIISDAGSSRYNLNFLMEKNQIKTETSIYDLLSKALSGSYLHFSNCPDVRGILKRTVSSILRADKLSLCFDFHELMVNILNRSSMYAVMPQPVSTLSDSRMLRMYKLQKVIFRCYMQDISLGYIAEKLYLSTRQASRVIQQYYGCTYRELVTQMRMKVAAEFLLTTDMTVLEISAQVGYNSIKGFYSAFKKQFNCLPTEYRKAHPNWDKKSKVPSVDTIGKPLNK